MSYSVDWKIAQNEEYLVFLSPGPEYRRAYRITSHGSGDVTVIVEDKIVTKSLKPDKPIDVAGYKIVVTTSSSKGAEGIYDDLR